LKYPSFWRESIPGWVGPATGIALRFANIGRDLHFAVSTSCGVCLGEQERYRLATTLSLECNKQMDIQNKRQ